MSTIYLDPTKWDLALDSNANIALATAPYQLAQDAASAIRTFAGEVFYDTTIGVPYFSQILGETPSIDLMKAQFAAAALTVPGVVAAAVFILSFVGRTVTGQVQVTDQSGAITVAAF